MSLDVPVRHLCVFFGKIFIQVFSFFSLRSLFSDTEVYELGL